MGKIKSEKRTISQLMVDNHFYNIPRYQRLFVWGDEQIKTLFNDINMASKSDQEMYFLGAIITVKSESRNDCYDLVDGQQRFTTLWLLANELRGDLTPFTKKGEKLRLQFAIRSEVYDYFEKLESVRISGTDGDSGQELYKVSRALKAIKSLISQKLNEPEVKARFIEFLLNKLTIIVTEVPPATDLNKLFETLNNRGVQLNQHEILKNKLLSQIPNKQERIRYGKIWNACSDMGNYLERNIMTEVGSNLAKFMHHNRNYLNIEDVFKELKSQGRRNEERFSLSVILKANKPKDASNNDSDFHPPNSDDDEFDPVRSILTFPQLLLHVLRIYRYKRGLEDIQRINEKELLTIFEVSFLDDPLSEKSSKSFIELLWCVRQTFDRYVIKWVKTDEEDQEEIHLIKSLEVRNQKKGGWTYYARRILSEGNHGLALLQSMLYHSQENITQYWLTPFLYRMYKEYPSNTEAYLTLKKLDNVLFSADSIAEKSLADKTWEYMSEDQGETYSLEVLDKMLGTQFPHYWFYKLEFVLWHEREKLNKEDGWKSYRLNSRNSVEHIGPQNPRDDRDKVCETHLDGFGNLVLVTRSINSEYGDMSYGEKKAKFGNKKEKGSYDSLKSDLIYDHETWNDEYAEKHKTEMKELLKSYIHNDH